MDFDVAIIGSGFGGSVAALRAAQKGLRVAVIEQGRWIQPEGMKQAAQQPTKLLWQPSLGLNGFFAQDFFRHVSLVRGIGVGGGSIVYAAVLLQPQQGFYDDPAWQQLPDRDWRQELAPHFDTAQNMLGMAVNPRRSQQDAWLQQTAKRLGVENTFGPITQAIHFGGDAGTPKEPDRPCCTYCGNCTTGCAVGAKNSLDKNYLLQAQQLGVRIISERRVQQIVPLAPGQGYRLVLQQPGKRGHQAEILSAKRVVVAGGVVGTVELLMACRDRYRTLPNLSAALGQHVRTNSETIAAVTHPDKVPGLRDGATISTHFYLDDLHVHQNRFSPSHRMLRWQVGGLVNDPVPWRRALKTAAGFALHPMRSTANMRTGRDWADRTTVSLWAVMAGTPEHGVINERHEVFGHPGLYVMDASAIPANVGVNPSLTITAMAERAMALF